MSLGVNCFRTGDADAAGDCVLAGRAARSTGVGFAAARPCVGVAVNVVRADRTTTAAVVSALTLTDAGSAACDVTYIVWKKTW